MSDLTRKSFLGLAAASLALPARAFAQPKPAVGVRPAERTLIRGADLLTMDRQGEILGADVLIDGGRIAAIGKGLEAGDARIVDGKGKILMPGLIDGHRHVWESIEAGKLVKTSKAYRNYDLENNLKYAFSFGAEDMYFAQLAGGLMAIDSGVTTVLDQMHATNGEAMEDAAVRGLRDSGISGFFCYQLRPKPAYGPGDTISHAKAVADRAMPPDERHYRQAEILRDRYFGGGDELLGFGIGLTGSIGHQTPQQVAVEFARVRAMGARIITQHMNQRGPAREGIVSNVTDLDRAGLLGPDYHISHGVDVTDAELALLARAGSKVCSTTLGEMTYPKPSIHGRARAAGIDTGIGLDVGIALTHDYFECVRSAYWSLYKSEAGMAIAKGYDSVDVLDFATGLGARALGLGDVTGTITVGKRADLLLLDTSRFGFGTEGSLADRVLNFAYQSDIDSLWIAGVRRKEKGAMIGVDWNAMAKSRAQVLERVFAKAATITIN